MDEYTLLQWRRLILNKNVRAQAFQNAPSTVSEYDVTESGYRYYVTYTHPPIKPVCEQLLTQSQVYLNVGRTELK